MGKNQILLIIGALIATASLYFFGQRVDSHKGHQHAASDKAQAPMAGPTDIIPVKFEELEKEALGKLNEADKIKESELTKNAADKPNALAYKDLAEFWEAKNELNMAAFNYKKAALLENTEKSVTFAGNLFSALMVKSEKAELKKCLALEAIGCYEKALELKPDNLNTKTALANCYTAGTGETMKGVLLLREITKVDSLNPMANLELGKLAVQSGQYEKAINRMEIVLSQQPKNTEAMYFLAESYKGQGNKEKAIELFEKCKSIVNNPDFSAEIDQYINSFK